MGLWKNLAQVLRHDRATTGAALGWEIAHSVLVAAPAGILLIVVQELFSGTPDHRLLWWAVCAMGALLLLQLYVAARTMVASNLMVYSASTRMRLALGDHLRKVSLGFFKKRDPGDIAAVLLQDVANFEGIFGHSVGNITAAFFGTVVLSSFLFFVDTRLALCLVAAIVLAWPVLAVANGIVRRSGKVQIAARNAVGARFLEYAQGIRHLRAYGLMGARNQALDDAFAELRRTSIRMEALPGPFVVIASVLLEIGFIAMLALGLHYLTGGSLTPAVLITFLILGYNLYQPVKVFMVDYLVVRYMNESLQRVIDVLGTPALGNGKDLRPQHHDITFSDVHFGYTDRATVQHIDLHVPERSMTALVGRSGSGKSTLVALVARFWDVDRGSIRIGGIDLRDMAPDTLHGMISEVFQEVYLFDDTIRHNVLIGKPDATEAELQDALDKACCTEFIRHLPDGLDTRVGEGGGRLSGGQKQRVSIARALLKNAPIVLLDEATASLDPENEFSIQQAIQALVHQRTVIVIAHKLRTVQHADNIVVLDKGQVVEQGKHAQLLSAEGHYARLWALQQQTGGWKVKA